MASIAIANDNASVEVRTPVTRGLFFVRSISLSMSRSMYMFIALAPPAARVPPNRVAMISHTEGKPSSATIIVGTVVIRRSSTTRSFINAMNPSSLLLNACVETVSFSIL